MAGGAGSARGRAGKYNKPKRGGGKSFSRGLQPTDGEGNQVSMWAEDAKDGSDDDDSEEEDSEEEEEDSDDEAGPSNAAAAPSGSGNREDRKAQKKARKEAALAKQKSKTIEVGDLPSSDESDDDDDDDMPANPNHSKSARKQADSGVEEVTEGVKNLKAPQNRREREAMEAQIAKEKYMKLQAEGKTDQAKADLARLKLIREQRAADAARRQAEEEERVEQEKVRKAEIDAREAKKRDAAMGPKKSSKKK